MDNRFSLTTRQAARLAKVEASVLYMSVRRHGSWRGVTPRKQPNGRLLWPRNEVLRACGQVSDGDGVPIDLRRFAARLESHGLPEDDPMLLAYGGRALSPTPDLGRDPAYAIEDMAYLFDENAAAAERLDKLLPIMTPRDRQRALLVSEMLASTWGSFAAYRQPAEGAKV